MPNKLLVTLYISFAVISIAINIGTQFLSTVLYQGIYYIEASILIGTISGLLPRYFLDKKYIFKYKTLNFSENGRLLTLYTLMSIVTTMVFWSTEYLFHHAFQADYMRYLGGILGLTIGFIIKYQLDKKFVFVQLKQK